MTTFVKTNLNCDLNFVMKSFHEWLLPKVTATTFEITQLDFSFVVKLLYISDHSESYSFTS